MYYNPDTICAISTPAGIGGIAVIRISGPEAVETVDDIFKGKTTLKESDSHKIIFGRIKDGTEIIDEVYVSIFIAPRTYTGEDVVEVSCHGSTFIARRILDLLLKKIRLAEPGEFTQRAFLNNKIDLTKAEAVADLLQAKTRKSHKAAIEQLQGSLHKKIEILLERITALRTLLELEIDFLEQGLVESDREKLLDDINQLDADLKILINSGEEGIILKEGFKISLVGAPNVGKSSIFNAFLESERAIVTPIPGTTRDYLEEAISLGGYLVRFFDTAGIRSTTDQIEKAGIQRSYDIIKDSHKVLFISDGKENKLELEQLERLIDPDKIIKVLNKADLYTDTEIESLTNLGFLSCSTVNSDGLNILKDNLLKHIEISDEDLHSGILTNVRQIAAVKKTISALHKAAGSLKEGLGPEFTAFDLKEASSALEEIVGLISTDDILNRIFSNFCIGK
jgi:tRNA modification GTPase